MKTTRAGRCAGTDPTAHMLTQTAVFLSKHPEWLEKLWEEQQDLINTYGEEVTPEVYHLTGTKYWFSSSELLIALGILFCIIHNSPEFTFVKY